MSAVLLALGAGLIALSVWASRRGGTRARSARLMAGLAPVSPEEALLVGEGRYLAVQGSIDAAEAFDDENHRPLVYRRERVLVREGDTWRELERAVRSVQFFITSPSASIEIDADSLGDGLVVIERQWEGSVLELVASGRTFTDDATSALVTALATSAPTLTARVVLEQISTLDRGTVVGLLRNGRLTAAGAGQPLVLTTLDRRDALRILGSEARGSLAISLITLAALVAGVLTVGIAIVGLLGEISASMNATPSPSPSQTVSPESGDARNGGVATGPGGLLGLVGALLLPLLIGAGIAIVARAGVRWRSARSRI
ncbi:MAG: hypothetical protein ACKO8J_04470, partial [Candidatus Limnocylindrus sp.]